MSMPRRPIPVGFSEDARLPHKMLYPKYHCSGDQIKRWRNELGLSNNEYDNRKKPVIQSDLDGNEIMRHNSIGEAARSVHGNACNISVVLSGKFKTMYGYRWRYAD